MDLPGRDPGLDCNTPSKPHPSSAPIRTLTRRDSNPNSSFPPTTTYTPTLVMSYSFVACFTFKTPSGQHLLAHEAGKKLVMREYNAWAYFQQRKPIMEAAKKRRREAVMREMGLDLDGKPLAEPTSASTEEQEQAQGEEQVADARTSADGEDHSADTVDEGEDLRADVGIKTEADAGTRADGQDEDRATDASSARGLKRNAEDEPEDEDRRTIKRFKNEHVGGVFGMVFRAMVKGLAKGGSEGRSLKGAGRVRSRTGTVEARRYKMPTYVLKTQVRPSWEGRRSMLEALRSVQLRVQPVTGRTLGMSSVESQMDICV